LSVHIAGWGMRDGGLIIVERNGMEWNGTGYEIGNGDFERARKMDRRWRWWRSGLAFREGNGMEWNWVVGSLGNVGRGVRTCF
jgi:hypothetical protein